MEMLTLETKAEIRNLVMRERDMAISDREWKHRLRGYGYAIKDTDEGQIVTSVLRDARLCSLPAH